MHQRCHEHVRDGRRGHQVTRHTVEGADAQDGDQDQEVPQESGRERQHQLRHHQPREDREGRLSTRQGGAAWGQLDDPAGAWAAALGFGSQAKGDPGGGHREVSCFHGAGRAGSRLLGGDARAPGAQRGQGGCKRRRGPCVPGDGREGSRSSYHGPSLCCSPPLAPLLGALVDLFSSGGKKKKNSGTPQESSSAGPASPSRLSSPSRGQRAVVGLGI